MCSGSEAGSYMWLIDVVYHSTLGLRVIKKKKKDLLVANDRDGGVLNVNGFIIPLRPP